MWVWQYILKVLEKAEARCFIFITFLGITLLNPNSVSLYIVPIIMAHHTEQQWGLLLPGLIYNELPLRVSQTICHLQTKHVPQWSYPPWALKKNNTACYPVPEQHVWLVCRVSNWRMYIKEGNFISIKKHMWTGRQPEQVAARPQAWVTLWCPEKGLSSSGHKSISAVSFQLTTYLM